MRDIHSKTFVSPLFLRSFQLFSLFFFFPSLLTFLFPPRLQNEWKFYTLHTFTTKFNDGGVSRAEKREERREREETA